MGRFEEFPSDSIPPPVQLGYVFCHDASSTLLQPLGWESPENPQPLLSSCGVSRLKTP